MDTDLSIGSAINMSQSMASWGWQLALLYSNFMKFYLFGVHSSDQFDGIGLFVKDKQRLI